MFLANSSWALALIGVSATLLSTATVASSIGPLTEPEARLALISEGRSLERRCAGLALFMAKRNEGISEAQAVGLLGAVSERLASDIGSEVHAFIHVSSAGLYWSNGLISQDVLEKEQAETHLQCQSILDAAGAGKPEAALTPHSPAPLKLPDVETCLAYADLARQKPYELHRLLADESYEQVRSRWLSNVDTMERSRRETTLVDRVRTMQPSLSQQQLEAYLGWACLPAVAAFTKQTSGDSR